MEDIRSRASIESALDHESVSSVTVVTGETIDRQGYEALDFCFNLDITTGVATFAVYEGDEDDMSDEAVVDDDFLIGEDGEATSATGTQVVHIGYVGHKRYTRVKVTGSDTPVYNVAGIAYKGKAKSAPTS